MTIIGISGKAESGKTTLATILKEELEATNKKVLIINYGDFVKFICKQYYNWNGDKDESGRALLQYIGTERGRVINENIWVDTVINVIDIIKNDFDVAIIADCRFPNEITRWNERDKQIFTIRIDRPNFKNQLTSKQQNHSSEIALDNFSNWNYHIYNIGSLEELRNKAKNIIKLIDDK